ncbi:MAG: hypothetical protein DCC49_05410 [Acidobacteria bacterium]|nr:MAG: hypothetical protein DCC49_05410 [Acidobacteriota bacterium]
MAVKMGSETSNKAESTAASTRARLVEAAAEVFAEQGYDRTRVQEIARRAGLTTGAIYANFEGKTELLAQAISFASTPELDRLITTGSGVGSAANVLIAIGEELAKGTPRTGSVLLFEAFAAARRDPDVAAALKSGIGEISETFCSLVNAGKDDGSIVEDADADAVARLSIALALGFLMLEMVGVEQPSEAAWSDVIHRIVGSISTGSDQSE